MLEIADLLGRCYSLSCHGDCCDFNGHL